MAESNRKRLIIILGMHRSGTSTITRGLQVMGVALGEKLMPAVTGNNSKGFWEDIDLNALNIEMLKALGSDWHHLAPVGPGDVEALRNQGYFLRAVELLRQKFGDAPVFGFKDPRVAKLLPFWKEVFSHCQFEVDYVIVLRHPFSVAKSLAKRDGIEAQKSYLLWMEHVISSLVGSADNKRIVVDYDRLMQAPERELARVAGFTGLKIIPEELESYKSEFLDQNLRHTMYELKDLSLDEACPPMVCEAYAALLGVASDETAIEDKALQQKIVHWSTELGRLKSPLQLIDTLFLQKRDAVQAIAACNEHIETLSRTVSEREAQIEVLHQAVSEREAQIAVLHQAVNERDAQIAVLRRVADERNAQIAVLHQTVDEREAQIQAFIAQRDDVFNSTSWKITKPLRYFRRGLNTLCRIACRIFSAGAYKAWTSFPVSTERKQLAKHKLFSRFPALFRRSQAYRRWHAMNAPCDEVSDPAADAIVNPIFSAYAYVPLLHAQPPKQVPVRLIAFYLPQFHEIAENNTWWGTGFTEWTNVRPAQPQFDGHYQPRVPGELGYYDLLDSATQRRQVELAKLYGVGGFCFYTYWFDGKLLLEKPVENYLQDRSLDLPFCLCWANENWSRRWDGLDSEILVEQRHSSGDDLNFIQHVARYMRDERYIRIDGKPLLLVYRPSLLPNARKTSERWRRWCRENGIGDIYLAYTQSFETADPRKYGFDAAIEFPPALSHPPTVTEQVRSLNKHFAGAIHDWRVFVKNSANYKKPGYKLFRGVCPSWDNTARRKNRGTIFINSSPQGYQKWLGNAIAETCARIENPEERLVFVNAWNEWAEGAYLEPDQYYGYAYLEATRRALLGESAENTGRRIIVVSHDAHPHGAQLLALGMVRALKQDMHLEVEVVLLGAGRLAADFAALVPVHDLSGAESTAITHLAESLARRGFLRAIVNTTASGGMVPVFHAAGIESICLIHELPGVIRVLHLEHEARQIAVAAKAVVFPAQTVADGFAEFAQVDQDRQFIRPQGLYRRNRWRLEKQAARARLREQFGLEKNTRIVLMVGYADRRKGVDLFVEAALLVLPKRSDVDFVWVGHWEQSMQREIEVRLAGSPYKNRIHFVGYHSDTALFHAASDVYALTSREDPFPNVVLESFDAGIPVVAFAGSGGAADMVERVGGIVVPAQSVTEFAGAVERLLAAPELSSRLGEAAQQYADRYFAFRPYLFELCGMLGMDFPRVSVIVPNYNYAQYIEERLSSIRGQSIPIFELIILDDASTDQSLEKISQWLSSTHTEARVIVNHENTGNAFAQWRRGVELATGDYVWIAEADDVSDPDFLETVLPPLVSGDAVLSYCESRQINPHGIVRAKNYHDYVSLVSQERWKNAYLTSGMEETRSSLAIMNTIPNVSAVVFKREVINAVLNEHFDEIAQYRKTGDWVVYFRTLARGDIAFSPRAANRHRRHEQSVIGGGDGQSLLREIIAVQETVASMYQLSEDVRQKAQAYREKLTAVLG